MITTRKRKKASKDQNDNLGPTEPRRGGTTLLRGFSFSSDQLVRANKLIRTNDNHLGTTAYSYDNSNNLQTMGYTNGVTHTWGYDNRNRLTNLTVTGPNSPVTINSYGYTLNGAGARTNVVEATSRKINWTYDNLMRLTGENITSLNIPDPTGGVTYTYDSVGNRLNLNGNLAAATTVISSQNFNGAYDTNDRLTAGYTYSDGGNTLTDQSNNSYTYDAENHLVSVAIPNSSLLPTNSTVSYEYDGDGNRTAKILNGVRTDYVVDTVNPTGYSQVLAEIQNGQVVKRFTFGHMLISQEASNGSSFVVSYYCLDGQNSVRNLTDANGNVTDSFQFDAYGNLLYSNGTTNNDYLYNGERMDHETGNYYLRARYMNPAIGRFTGMDSFEGDSQDPISLHKYEFVANNPVNLTDPDGHEFDICSLAMSAAIVGILATFPSVSEAGTAKEANIIVLITDFNNASVDTGINVNVLGSLGWSESANGALGYWDRNTHNSPNAHGIMQLWGPENEGLSDADNIEKGAKILKEKVNDAKKIKHKLYGQSLTPAQLADSWFIPIALYKASLKNASTWENQIYSSWPNVEGTFKTPTLLRTLWAQNAK